MRQTTQEFIEALEDAGFDPEEYSGRGMYGKSCVSIKNESPWAVARALPADLDIPEPNEDQLGRGVVIYWPRFVWEEDGDQEEAA